MMSKTRLTGAAMVTLLLAVSPAGAEVSVWFDAEDSVIVIGDTVTVNLMAEFTEPVVAWGLDVLLSDPGYVGLTDVAIGGSWDATDTLDEDGLAGLRFPVGMSGEVLLATLTFEAYTEGITELSLSDGPEEDEGFQLEFGGLDDEVDYGTGSITVIPEPAAGLLLGLGMLVLSRRRRRRASSSI